MPIPKAFFSGHMASATLVCYTKSKQGELIESGQNKGAAFYFPALDLDGGSKAFQNLLFLNSRNTSLSRFGVYSFEPGFHYGDPCLRDMWLA